MSEVEKKAFIVEVKANPDRAECVEDFVKKLELVREFLSFLKQYEVYGIYAALDMKPKTVELLTKKGIYAVVLKGDILEIINFDDLSVRTEAK